MSVPKRRKSDNRKFENNVGSMVQIAVIMKNFTELLINSGDCGRYWYDFRL